MRHQKQYITLEYMQNYLTNYLDRACSLFEGKPVWYRASEMEMDEVAVLGGCDYYVRESMPLLGTRGIRRAMLKPDTFKQELLAFKQASNKHNNLGVLFPYVATPEEFAFAKDCLSELDIDCKVGMMLEIPSVIFRLEEFLNMGLDYLLVGSNDLTGLIMGDARGSGRYIKNNPAMQNALRIIYDTCKSKAVELSITGYLEKDLISYCSDLGFDGYSVHYADLPELISDKYADLKDLGLLREIKAWTIEQKKIKLLTYK